MEQSKEAAPQAKWSPPWNVQAELHASQPSASAASAKVWSAVF